MFVRRALLVCVLALLGACAQPMVLRDGVSVPVERAARSDLERARRHLGLGELDRAAAVLEALHTELPRSRRAAEALFLLGEVRQSQGKRSPAIVAWRGVLERYAGSRWAPEASLRLAALYREMGRSTLARLILRDATVARADGPTRVRIHRLQADLARSAGDYSGAVLALAHARRDTAVAEELYLMDLEAEELVRERLRDGELESLIERLPRGPVYDEVLLEVARRAIAKAEFGAAAEALDRLPRRLHPAEDAERRRLRSRAQLGVQTVVHTLGLAVPLSGSYVAFGEAVLRGVTLALGIFEEPAGRYRILIRDTEGEIEGGQRAVRELSELGVTAIIGPMRSVVAAEAAPLADSKGVPLLTLSSREDIAGLGDFVFRLGLAASNQVDVIATYAMKQKGHRRFAILYPRAGYGRNFKNLFWEEVERRGGEIVGVEGYDPESVDHQVAIRKLIGLEYLTDEEEELIAERERLRRRPVENEERLLELAELELPPYIDFDALFIPDVAGKVGLILPQLRLYDVNEVEFIGTSDWNDSKLLEIAGRDAWGTVFTDAFHVQSRDPTVSSFVARFRSDYVQDPDLFAAQGFDTALIIRRLIERSGQLSRRQLQQELLRVRDFPGSSGLTSFDEAGSTRRELHLLTVDRGRIRELDEVP